MRSLPRRLPPIPREVIAETAAVYIGAFETITGQSFAAADPETPPLTAHSR